MKPFCLEDAKEIIEKREEKIKSFVQKELYFISNWSNEIPSFELENFFTKLLKEYEYAKNELVSLEKKRNIMQQEKDKLSEYLKFKYDEIVTKKEKIIGLKKQIARHPENYNYIKFKEEISKMMEI